MRACVRRHHCDTHALPSTRHMHACSIHTYTHSPCFMVCFQSYLICCCVHQAPTVKYRVLTNIWRVPVLVFGPPYIILHCIWSTLIHADHLTYQIIVYGSRFLSDFICHVVHVMPCCPCTWHHHTAHPAERLTRIYNLSVANGVDTKKKYVKGFWSACGRIG